MPMDSGIGGTPSIRLSGISVDECSISAKDRISGCTVAANCGSPKCGQVGLDCECGWLNDFRFTIHTVGLLVESGGIDAGSKD